MIAGIVVGLLIMPIVSEYLLWKWMKISRLIIVNILVLNSWWCSPAPTKPVIRQLKFGYQYSIWGLLNINSPGSGGSYMRVHAR